jgi:glycosyltransferase involved in cell wall biosynthesis
MNVGMVNEYFVPFAPGGAERSTLFLAQRLAQSRVVVITPNYGAAPHEEIDGVLVDRFAMPFKLRAGQRMLPYGYLANPLFYAYSAIQIVRRVKKYDLQILHVHNKQSLVGATWAGRLTGVPVLVSLRDYLVLCRYGMCLNKFDTHPDGCDWRSYLRCLHDYLALYMPELGAPRRALVHAAAVYHRLDTTLKQAALRRADAVVMVSDKMRRIYISRGLDPTRTLTIYNPMPAFDVAPAVRENGRDGADTLHPYDVLYAGKLSWGKGPHVLVEALPAIREALSGRPLRVTLAGQGPLRPHLEQRVAELELSDQVTFAGQLPYEQLRGLYGQADVVVVPSVWQEPFGRVALEALMSGTPAVVSNRGGLGEIVEDGETGLVVEPEPRAIAKGVVRVLRSPEMRTRVQAALPQLQRKFGSDVSAAYLEVYKMLLAGQSPNLAGRDNL